jgi:hypothetical protein
LAKGNCLNGFHYFATNNINAELSKILSDIYIFIPRYLQFDADGKLPRPSEKEQLYKRITDNLNLSH